MKRTTFQLLFRVFSFLSDKTNGAPLFVKGKLLLGTLILGLVGTSAKAQKKEVAPDTIRFQEDVSAEISCYKPAAPIRTPSIVSDSIEVRGTVKDSIGEPLVGVAILVKNTRDGTVAGLEGDFLLKVKASDMLVFSMVGFHSQEIRASEVKDIVVMREDSVALSCYIVMLAEPVGKKKTQDLKVDRLNRAHMDSTLSLRSTNPFIMCYGIVGNPYYNDDIYVPKPKKRQFSYSQASCKPVPPSGDLKDFAEWLQKQVRYNKKMLSERIGGKVVVGFVVNEKGKLVNKKIVSGLSKEADREALRVLSLSDKWKPGEHYGRPVDVIVELTIHFNLPEQD